ncbi:MAG: phosphomethylpyrimidine synthase ThiC, partial [Alphaproteobacteria bacterium]
MSVATKRTESPITADTVTTGPLPASRKIYVQSPRMDDVRVPMREIELSGGEPPFSVYDTSGPYTDPEQSIDITKGLPPLRSRWIEARGDAQAYEGRALRPEDDGLKSGQSIG